MIQMIRLHTYIVLLINRDSHVSVGRRWDKRGEEGRQMSRDEWVDSQGMSRRAMSKISRVAGIWERNTKDLAGPFELFNWIGVIKWTRRWRSIVASFTWVQLVYKRSISNSCWIFAILDYSILVEWLSELKY